MIKLPKDVGRVIKTLENERFEAYAVGECVRDTLAGLSPYGWDVATSAKPEDVMRLFPEAQVLNHKYGVVRMEFIEEKFDEQGEFKGEEGIILDVASFRKLSAEEESGTEKVVIADTVQEDLSRRTFTVNAIAENTYSNVDPYGGVKDIEAKLVRTIGSADQIFKKDPIKMMEAVRIVSDLGFDLHEYKSLTHYTKGTQSHA